MRVRDRGFALLIVLLSVAALFALAVRSAISTRSTTLEVGVVHDRVAAERGARGAAVLAIRGMLNASRQAVEEAQDQLDPFRTRTPQHDDPAPDEGPKDPEIPAFLRELLGDKLKQVEEGAKDAAKGSTMGALTDGGGMAGRVPRGTGMSVLRTLGLPTRPLIITLEGRRYTVSLSDAAGQLSLNGADDRQFMAYFRAKGFESVEAQTITDQILDWRDPDNIPRARGAEQEVYERLGITCRNAPFTALEELLFLPAITRDIFEAIRADLSLTVESVVHVGSASRAVLASVEGLAPDAVERIIALRESGGLTAASLQALMPLTQRDSARKSLRFEPSSIVRITVEASDASSPPTTRGPGAEAGPSGEGYSRPVTRFEGIAVIDDNGLRDLGLRAIQ